MDYDASYDNGARRRTMLIVGIAVVAVLIGIGVIVALVIKNRSASSARPAAVGKVNGAAAGGAQPGVANVNGAAAGGAQPAVAVPAATTNYTIVDSKYASGLPSTYANIPIVPPTNHPKPGVDRNLTDDEKKQWGYPLNWTVRMQTVMGKFGLETQLTVIDHGSGGRTYPTGMENTPPPPKP